MNNFNILKKVLPEILIKYLKHFFGHKFIGNYHVKDWDKILKFTSGYNHKKIINKIFIAQEKILSGQSKFQRDGINFDKIDFPQNLIIALLYSSTKNRKIKVLDYGGSTGNVYFQIKSFLKNFNYEWSIIDQKEIISFGKKKLQNDELFFFYDYDEYSKIKKSNLLIFSNSFQYIKDSMSIFDFLKKKFDYIFFYSLPVHYKLDDHIKIEKPNKNIYNATYPMYVYNNDKIIKKFEKTHEIIFNLESKYNNFLNVQFRDFFLVKKNGKIY